MAIIGLVSVENNACSWKINNFQHYAKLPNASILSPVFKMKKYEWQMLLNTNNFSCDGRGQITIILRCLNEAELKVAYSCELVSQANQKSHKSDKSTATFSAANYGHGKFFEKDLIMDRDGKPLERNNLTAVYRIDILDDAVVMTNQEFIDDDVNCFAGVTKEHRIFDDYSTTETKLVKDYEKLLNQEEFSDLILLANGRRLFAHKNILACRSEVFADMIRDAVAEGENTITIEDFDDRVMMEILRFVYSGRVNRLTELTFQLYIASDRYGLKDLNLMCENALCRDLHIGNVFNYVVFADSIGADRLKRKALNFIKSNLKIIVKSPMFSTESIAQLPARIVMQIFESLT